MEIYLKLIEVLFPVFFIVGIGYFLGKVPIELSISLCCWSFIKFIKYLLKDKGLTIKGAKNIINKKKNIDVNDKNIIEDAYLKDKIKKKSFNILKKIKKLKSYG